MDSKQETQTLGPLSDSLGHAPTQGSESPTPPPEPGLRARKPNMLERYTVLRQLGAGGMGKVYLAYDERLDRRVAIKLLLHEHASDRSKQRLLREAQAMARLAHPNVVTVFEVGEVEDEIFIAMEYIQGSNLRHWLRREPRTRAQILAVFQAAGEGLAAAHEAGIIHRDFKPDNVLVGDDGRVLVADFGLAHGGGDASMTTEEELESGPSIGSQPRPRLTQTGAMVGTPAYMAAELLRGATGDARSDQFAFCVSLWEALFGARPYRGASLRAVRASVLLERLHEPAEHDVPLWLRETLLRGLRADPEQRWPDMATLIDAIADDPELRRRRRTRAVLLTSLTLSLIGILASIATTELRANARHRFWSALTEDLLELERDRSLAQAHDDARRAKDASRLTAFRSYRHDPSETSLDDPTAAALLLREVEGPRERGSWRSLANATLGDPLSYGVLRGHHDTIRALVLDSAGATLYSASADGELWRWDTRTGQGRRIDGHEARVNTLALSPDEHTLAAAYEDGLIRVWRSDGLDAPSLELRHAGGVTDLAFDSAGARLVSSSRSGEARIDALAGGEALVLRGHADAVLSARFDRQGQRVLTTGADASARLWSAASGELLETLEGHEAGVYFAEFAADDTIVTGADDGDVRAWRFDAQRGSHLGELLTEQDGSVTALAVHGSLVASAASDRSIRLTPLDAPSESRPITGHREDVWSLAFTPDGSALLTASRDGTARVTRTDGSGVPLVLRGHHEPLLRLAVDGTGRWLATGSWDTDIRLWDLARPRLATPLRGHTRPVVDVTIDPSEDAIVSASLDGTARRWRRDGTLLDTLEAGFALNRVVATPEGTIVGGTNEGSVLVWTPPNYTLTELGPEGERGSIRDLALSTEGTRLLVGTSAGEVEIWTLEGDAAPVTLDGHQGPVMRVAFSSDGAWAYSAGADGALLRWHGHSGELDRRFEGHEAGILDFVLSPDQRLVASASDDKSARVWLSADPSEVLVLAGHDQKVLRVAFDHQVRRLLTASADGTARVWSTDEGTELHVLRGHEGPVWGAYFLAEDRLVTHSDDGTLRL